MAILGIPNIVVTDNAAEFKSQEFESSLAELGIHHKFITPYKPSANGLIERAHRQLKVAMRCLDRTENWAGNIGLITLMINNQPSDLNFYSPYQKVFGQPSNLTKFQTISSPEETQDSELSGLEINNDVTIFIENMRHHPKKVRELPEVQVQLENDIFTCTKVLVRREGHISSLSSRYTGPYLIVQRNEKYFRILTENGIEPVAIERLKVFKPLPTIEDLTWDKETSIENLFESESDTSIDEIETLQTQEVQSNRSRRNVTLPAQTNSL